MLLPREGIVTIRTEKKLPQARILTTISEGIHPPFIYPRMTLAIFEEMEARHDTTDYNTTRK